MLNQYSVPLDAPKDFEIKLFSVTNTSAQFQWKHVNTSINRIRGYFIGYQVFRSCF